MYSRKKALKWCVKRSLEHGGSRFIGRAGQWLFAVSPKHYPHFITLVLRRKQDACYDRDLRALTDDWGVIRVLLLDFVRLAPRPPGREPTHSME